MPIMDIIFTIIVIFCFLGIFKNIILYIFKSSKRTYFSRHNRNIRTAKSILKEIRSWEGENLNPRIFNYLRKINAFVFEELILEAFEDKGFRIQRNARYTGDGGIDGIVFDTSDQLYLIQAKRYEKHIALEHVKQFCGLVKTNRVKGFFIHTGKTGKGCRDLLNKEGIILISGARLIELMLNRQKDRLF